MEEPQGSTTNELDFVINPDGSITVDGITIPPAPVPALTNEATKERLIITDLMVRDFKSYAGNHVIGPFNKNFSCIVGPNGSGKSNVIDALLFVFGYRAQKIRSKKVSVLIHKSHKYPDLQSCSVTVNFATIKDEGIDYTVLPDSKFSVTRTGCSDNSSTYEIDGRRKQYKEVANLLKTYGIDLEYNRFMILQGEIELISMMKPKAPNENDPGMLEYIEDIIGSNRFIEPTKHFYNKVEELNEVRMEKLNNLKIVEKERADAEKPRNKAMEYLRLANKLALMENSVFQAQIQFTTENGQKLTEKIQFLSEKMNTTSADLDELQAAKEMKEIEVKEVAREFNDRSKVVEELKNKFTELERHDAAVRENMKNNKEKLKKVEKTLESEEKKVHSLRKQPEVLKKELEELEIKMVKLGKDKVKEEEKLTEVMGSMKDEIQELQEKKDSFEKELIEVKNVLFEKKAELDLSQSELDICLSSERKEKDNFDAMQADYEKLLDSIKAEEISIKDSSDRLPQAKRDLSSAKEKLLELDHKEENMTEEIKSKRLKLDEVKSAFNASQSRNTLIKAFLDEKKKGNFKGVYGRLGDLGAIGAKYDIAISTACGPLDNIVTDTMTTAQECVQFLKRNNLGYATFIALEKMKKWEPYTKQKIKTPENVPRLFDLITVKDEAILPAFYYALQDTLVADSLEQATRVSFDATARHRVVTLKGQLIDSSGTMSGGGNKHLKGRMGQAVVDNSLSEDEVQQLESDVASLTHHLIEVKKSKQDLKQTIEATEKEITSLQHALRKTKMNHEGYLEREKILSLQIREQKEKILAAAPDPQKIAEIQSQIKKHEKSYNKASESASVVENKVKELQDQILAITKGKYGSVQKKINNLSKEVNQVAQNISKQNGLLKNCDKNLKKAEDKVFSLQADLESFQKEKDGFMEEMKSLEERGIKISDLKKKAEEALLGIDLLKTKSSTEMKEISVRIHQLKKEVIDYKNQIKNMEIDLRSFEGQLKTLKHKLSKLELHEIEEGPAELPVLTAEEIEEVSVNSVQIEVGRIQNQMKDMNPDLTAIAEFKKKEEMYKQKVKDLEETVAERDHQRRHHEELKSARLREFMRGFGIITLKVKELYQMMTLGGDAELELVDSVDPFSEGIEFSVRPLRKSWKSIRNLSGGEKTLSSLSLVFALHYYRTTPFFVMDEIDAALDFRNVSIIGSYIKDCTKNSQFIVISLRENMFLLADHLIGIYKTNNRTKNVCLSPPPEELAQGSLSPSSSKDAAFDKLRDLKPKTPKPTTVPVDNEVTKSTENDFDALFEVQNDARSEEGTKGPEPRSSIPSQSSRKEDSNDSFVFKTPAAKTRLTRKISFLDEIDKEKEKTPKTKAPASRNTSILDEIDPSLRNSSKKTPAAKAPKPRSTSSAKSSRKTPRSNSVAFYDENQPSEESNNSTTSVRRSLRLRTPAKGKDNQSAGGDTAEKTPGKSTSRNSKSASASMNSNESAESPAKKLKILHTASVDDCSDDEDFVFKTPSAKTPILKNAQASKIHIFSSDEESDS